MSSPRNALLERFFTAMISGDRAAARDLLDEVFDADVPAERIAANLFWPTLEQLQTARRADRLSELSYHYATRLMRGLTDQLQLRYQQADRNGKSCLVVTGAEESEELTGQLAADLLEAAGYTVFYAGGGCGQRRAGRADRRAGHRQARRVRLDPRDGAADADADRPAARDRFLSAPADRRWGGACSTVPRAWPRRSGPTCGAKDPIELVEVMLEMPEQRMTADQRTVGRRRKDLPRRTAA